MRFDWFLATLLGFALIIVIIYVVAMIRLQGEHKGKSDMLAELTQPRDSRGRFVKREAQ